MKQTRRVASYEANRTTKLRAIKEEYDAKKGKEPKEGEKRDA